MLVETAQLADTLVLSRGRLRVVVARRPFAIDVRRDGRCLLGGFGL